MRRLPPPLPTERRAARTTGRSGSAAAPGGALEGKGGHSEEPNSTKETVLPPAASAAALALEPRGSALSSGSFPASRRGFDLVGVAPSEEPTIAELVLSGNVASGAVPSERPPARALDAPPVPTLWPSAATVRPPAAPRRVSDVLASFFWGALAVAFGASSAAFWWEVEIENEQARAGASRLMTRLPDTVPWVQSASRLTSSSGSALKEAGRAGASAPQAPFQNASNGAAPDDSDPGEKSSDGATDLTSGGEGTTCAQRFFLEGTFAPEEDLTHLCASTDLRNVKERVHLAVLRQAAGAKTPGLVSWGTLGWYQLPLLAAARHACCPADRRSTQLPQQHGQCDGLGRSIDELAQESLSDAQGRSERVEALGREYAGRVQCLYRSGRSSAFGYTFRPSQQNRAEFERLLGSAPHGP